MTSGAVTLRQIHGTRDMLDVHCDRCGRSGRYRVATLVERYGLDAGLPAIASALGMCGRGAVPVLCMDLREQEA